MTSLADATNIVKVGPYHLAESYEKDGHYYFKLGLEVKGRTIPYIFAIPATSGDAKAAITEQLKIVNLEHAIYIQNGVPPGGMPTWG